MSEKPTSHPHGSRPGPARRRPQGWKLAAALVPLIALAIAGCSSSAGTSSAGMADRAPATSPAAGTAQPADAEAGAPAGGSTAQPAPSSVATRTPAPAPALRSTAAGNPVQYSYTGTTETWVVPAGVTSVRFEAAGGDGGGAVHPVTKEGGSGAIITGSFPVTAGQIVTIAVGGDGATGAGGWGAEGMSGGPANTAKQDSRTGGAGGGATLIALSNADGSNWHEIVVAGGGGGQGGGSGDPDLAGMGGSAGCLEFSNASDTRCGTPGIAGMNGSQGTAPPLGGKGGAAGGATSSTGARGIGAKDLGGNGGSGGGGVTGGAAGGGASGISAGGGGGAGRSFVDSSVVSWQISATQYNGQFTASLAGAGVILSW
ncbi:glycine-rich protein [Microbacterium sp. RU33B]|uniref:glycine-rich protein n=1 Tax=Microbacterium sp. RU33B TaxID=1907390 RepID=UPI0009640556|nr:glycine-rich protein [Microbacterium sp. RU33B]SIT66558.1 Glycine rich protein [Microbacterium sp. RU33B]